MAAYLGIYVDSLYFFSVLKYEGLSTALLLTVPDIAAAGVFGFVLFRKERQMLQEGDCYEGRVIAYAGYGAGRSCYIEVEFFIENERYTTVDYLDAASPRERLSSAECTIYCKKLKGRRRCVVRDLQRFQKWYSIGIDVPQKEYAELYQKYGIACSDKELASLRQKQLAIRRDAPSYDNLYRKQ